MNETKPLEIPNKPVFGTERTDDWWKEPALVAVGFALFIVYATWRAFENNYYEVGNLLSPFYSPKLEFDWWKWSPAILILWIPAGFRATCYYYRKAYYRSYFVSPPACAVNGIGGYKYCGEKTFPFVFQNIHRYMFYFAVLVLGILWYDTVLAFMTPDKTALTVSLGSFVFLINVLLLSFYTFGCHAFRHLVGGNLDCFSCSGEAKTKLGIWEKVTKLNEHHQFWAWCSLFSVGFTDFYVRLCATGAFTDIKFF